MTTPNCFCLRVMPESHGDDCIWTVMTEAVEVMQGMTDHILRIERRVDYLEWASGVRS